MSNDHPVRPHGSALKKKMHSLVRIGRWIHLTSRKVGISTASARKGDVTRRWLGLILQPRTVAQSSGKQSTVLPYFPPLPNSLSGATGDVSALISSR